MGKHEAKNTKKKTAPKKEPKKTAVKGEEKNVIAETEAAEQTESLDIYSSQKKADKANGKDKKKTLIIVLSIVLAVCILIGGAVIWALNYFDYNQVDVDHEKLGVNTENSEDHIVNIALFGIDTRNAGSMKGLSDSIMVLSVNKKTKQIKIISVMRDSVVRIDDRVNKINSAYSKGGAELAIRTLNQNFGLDITDYATVNFGGMAELIDKVGGVECDVTWGEIQNEVYGVNAIIKEISRIYGVTPQFVKTAGKQTLNGIQATSWSRIRMVSTANGERDDYGRTARQRHVLNQLFEKAKNMSITQYPSFIKSFLPHVETSLTYSEIFSLATAVLQGGTLTSTRIPYDNCNIPGGGGVPGGVYYSLDFASKLIKSYIYDDITFDDYIAANGIDKTPWN